MAKIIAYVADGLEEVECLAVVDVVRRAGIEIILTSIKDDKHIVSSHSIRFEADALASVTDPSDADMIFLPGGQPGTNNLKASPEVEKALKQFAAEGKRIAAICAAPTVLGKYGLLDGKTATCYPGCESMLGAANHVSDGVVTDGNITTARGLGYAIALGLEIIRLLISEEKSLEIKAAIQRD